VYKNQRGVTLIVVLLLLVAITIIGALAIRASTTQLRIATAGQAQQLMIQNSDAALFQVENPIEINKNMAMNGLFGYISREHDSGKELVFCYKAGDTRFFTFSKASLISWNGNNVKNEGLSELGFCRMQSDYFGTQRKTVMTQIAIKAADMTEAEAFAHLQTGTDPDSAKVDPAQLYTVVATTIFPDLGKSVPNVSINNCFKNQFNAIPESRAAALDAELTPKSTDAEKEQIRLAKLTVSQCLTDLGVPTHTQVARYALMQNFSKI
jgi:Tfp pilus assembly protein PilV